MPSTFRLFNGLCACFLVLAATAAGAAAPGYNYGGAGVFLADTDGDDAEGIYLEGSLALTDRLHVLVEAADGELDDDDADLETWRAMLGGRLPIRTGDLATDFVLRAGIAGIEIGSADDDGLAIEGQMRTMLSEQFELNLGGQYQDLNDPFSDDVKLELGAVYSFTPALAVQGSFGVSDEISSFELGLRYYFGGIF